eukprot:7570696-Ditylum_brightwellii.AAC.1
MLYQSYIILHAATGCEQLALRNNNSTAPVECAVPFQMKPGLVWIANGVDADHSRCHCANLAWNQQQPIA